MEEGYLMSFGVQAAFKQEMKLWGPIGLEDVAALFVAAFFIMIFKGLFQDDTTIIPQICFDLTIVAITIYSLIPPRTNPGKRNIDLLWLSFRHSKRFFQSLSVSQSVRMSSLYSFGVNGPHRLHISRSDLRGE